MTPTSEAPSSLMSARPVLTLAVTDHVPFRSRFSLRVLLLLIAGCMLQFSLFAQQIEEVELTLGLRDESLVRAFRKIEAATPFHFMYREEEVEQVRNLSLPPSRQSVSALLEALLANTPLRYRQVGRRILITNSKSVCPYGHGHPGQERLRGPMVNSPSKSARRILWSSPSWATRNRRFLHSGGPNC